MNTLTTKDLAIGYRKNNAPLVVLAGINVSLQSGEMVCLIGANGCGKSTLLRTLGGLQKPLAGSVLVGETDFLRLPNAAQARCMGLVLTEPVSVGKMTVHEVVALGRYPHTGWLGRLSPADLAKTDESIRLVHLEHKANDFFDELSDGEKQRAVIAKALAQDTPIILLDEPTAHLDLPNRAAVLLLLRKLAAHTGKAILLSTHDLDMALQTADRIWLMADNKIVAEKPQTLVQDGSLQAVFQNNAIRIDETGKISILT